MGNTRDAKLQEARKHTYLESGDDAPTKDMHQTAQILQHHRGIWVSVYSTITQITKPKQVFLQAGSHSLWPVQVLKPADKLAKTILL